MADPDAAATIGAWFDANVPRGWFVGPVHVQVDREEVLVIGALRDPAVRDPAVRDPDQGETARAGVIEKFREATRQDRITLASLAEAVLGRKVSWAVTCGPMREVFSVVSVPVMTRLRMSERAVLDTLVDASVARTRSEALAWCVRLVGTHEGDWLSELRQAMVAVERVRRSGPSA